MSLTAWIVGLLDYLVTLLLSFSRLSLTTTARCHEILQEKHATPQIRLICSVEKCGQWKPDRRTWIPAFIIFMCEFTTHEHVRVSLPQVGSAHCVTLVPGTRTETLPLLHLTQTRIVNISTCRPIKLSSFHFASLSLFHLTLSFVSSNFFFITITFCPPSDCVLSIYSLLPTVWPTDLALLLCNWMSARFRTRELFLMSVFCYPMLLVG